MPQRSSLARTLVSALSACLALAASVSALGGPGPAQPARDRVVGVKIYEHEGDLARLFSDFQDRGFNTLFVSEALASNPQFRTLAREGKMAVFLLSLMGTPGAPGAPHHDHRPGAGAEASAPAIPGRFVLGLGVRPRERAAAPPCSPAGSGVLEPFGPAHPRAGYT